MNIKGFGTVNAQLSVYIENTPPIEQYTQQEHIKCLSYEEIRQINNLAGNGWRKVFNVYAKFMFELCPLLAQSFPTWQQFREQAFLQQAANHNLLMSLDKTSFQRRLEHKGQIHIIAGKGYAERLGVASSCHWLSPHFALDKKKHLIICPYFDYRQLTNERISILCKLVRSLKTEYQALQQH